MGNFSIRDNGNVIVSPSMTFLPHDNAIINKAEIFKESRRPLCDCGENLFE